jgi:TFIIF-interacting CTD phosphatase-like protein
MEKKIIAFDIDNTLFYTSSSILTDSLELIFNTKKRYVKIRPNIDFLFDYLEENKDFFEVIVYSAATRDYVNNLLNYIEKNYLITKVYDREFCDKIIIDNREAYVKNYKKINHELHNLYLIDDDDRHFQNMDVIGYKCKKYTGETDDEEIFHMIEFLETVKLI